MYLRKTGGRIEDECRKDSTDKQRRELQAEEATWARRWRGGIVCCAQETACEWTRERIVGWLAGE